MCYTNYVEAEGLIVNNKTDDNFAQVNEWLIAYKKADNEKQKKQLQKRIPQQNLLQQKEIPKNKQDRIKPKPVFPPKFFSGFFWPFPYCCS